ncbi:MAG: 4'-phosphopantetheinyl transferase superfamily protein [Anaerolineales bacterium]|nr:4'-phosphopantetheinyl transferase superfamily protein [Anaerolineales bacterium]
MIHWLVQTAESLPTRRDFLCVMEMEKLPALKIEKRQRDWLLGRWTAKQLIQAVLRDQGRHEAPDALCIGNRAGGEPFFQFAQGETADNYPLTLSISHSANHAFCAVVERPFWPLGADIERIETRHPGFVQDYFTNEEQALVAQAPPPMQDTLITAVWSAKEAALKALHVGLRADTRAVSCLIGLERKRPLNWTSFTITLDSTRLAHTPTLTGWWRIDNNFVLTIVTKQANTMKKSM